MESKSALILVLIVTFLLGSFGGYFVRTATASPARASDPAAVCGLGSHPVVWYSAGVWACVSD